MIPIRNIYYMLAYAFQVLQEDKYRDMHFEEFDHIEDLLAAILAKGIASQIKRGLGREYLTKTEAISTPRGRFDIADTLKRRTLLSKQIVCEFDELSENIYFNRVLKTTAFALLHYKDLKPDLKASLKKAMFFFHEIDTIAPRDIHWSQMKYHRNNATYRMLMNICRLALERLLPSTQDGNRQLTQFKDDLLPRLYERFLREFYVQHFKGRRDICVSASHIDWIIEDGTDPYLPRMKSDIMIEHENGALIIDAKYYGKSMQKHFGKHTIHSHNLYQIFSYVKNKDRGNTGNVRGMLLYAKTDEEITPDSSYRLSGNQIDVITLDLNTEWPIIKDQLCQLVEEFDEPNNDS